MFKKTRYLQCNIAQMHYGPLGSACGFPFPHRLNQLLLLCCLHAERSSVIKKMIESIEIQST